MEDKRETFHQEIGKIICYFNKIIDSLDFNTDNLKVILRLIKKVMSNTTSANILILEDCLEDAQIVLRSAIETVVLIAYLCKFPEKTMEYLADSQILQVKNNFIAYKMTKDNEPLVFNGEIISQEILLEENEKWFKAILPMAQEKILTGINENEYKINDNTLSKMDKYFQRFKPFFMNLKLMYEELSRINFKIGNEFDLKDGIFPFYNESSQVAHGCYFDWDFKKTFEEEAEHFFQFFNKAILLIKILLDETMNTNPNRNTNELFLNLKKSVDNLNQLIYGEKYLYQQEAIK